jgi:hypothetical protein
VIRLEPDNATASNALSWLLATCPEAASRDGKRAVELGTKACELTGWKVALCIETLAAAHAEAGDFAKAIEMQEKANGLHDDAEAREKGEKRLALYRKGKPFRDIP